MSVYVDRLTVVVSKDPKARRVGRRNGHRWCHMWADTLPELHRMASIIGMRREWFQNDARLPHYDLTPERRREALRFGAVEAGRADLVSAIRVNKGKARGRL